jgi:transcriptional regulator with XRE-family HTH domain
MYSESFPSRLKETRKSHGFTQAEVAEHLGIGRANISHYETGRIEPDIETLTKLADFYGVSTDFLIGNGLHDFHGFEPESSWDGVKIRTTDFPQKMKLARTIKGQSQERVAKILKIPRSTLAKYELGQLQPSLETLAKITLYYRVRADWLLGLSDSPEYKPAI